MKRFDKPKIELIVDSGAFSSWNRGEPDLNLNEYIRYIKRNRHLIFACVNMDSIPGSFGTKRTAADVEKSARKSYDNLQEMKSHGLSPIPVFHAGEDFKWLERLLADGETYIGFSSSKDTTALKTDWLDRLFSMICDRDGNPLIRIHGFALTRPLYVLRYPWFSIDSTTWSLDAGMGHMLVPRYVGGKPDYSQPPEAISVTGIQQANPNQLEAMRESFHGHVLTYLETVCGLDPVDVRYSTDARRKTYIVYYLNLIEYANNVLFKHRHTGVIKPKKVAIKNPIQRGKLRMMFATSATAHSFSDLLNQMNVKTRLLSYYELQHETDDALAEYVMAGTMRTAPARKTMPRMNTETYWNLRRLMLRDHLRKTEP